MRKKKCSKCGEIKTHDNFYNAKKSSDGLQYYCKPCIQKTNRSNTTYKFRRELSEVEKEKNRIRSAEWRKKQLEKDPVAFREKQRISQLEFKKRQSEYLSSTQKF